MNPRGPNKSPRIRLTVEMLDTGADPYKDFRVCCFLPEESRIAGDVFMNRATLSYSLEVNAGEIYLGIGQQASQLRDAGYFLASTRTREVPPTIADVEKLCGYVGDGSSVTLTICQDDATRQWCVTVGKKTFYGNTMRDALNVAGMAKAEES